jgi:lysozyme family protein
MADFLPAFEKMIVREGGYVLHTVAGDTGGQTYAGIARNKNPQWQGWSAIDQGSTPAAELVRSFYKANFWDVNRLNEIEDQRVASTVFDFGVNAGTGTAAKLAQLVVGSTPDGRIGAKTVEAINTYHPDLFLAHYTLAKIARYRDIVRRDRVQARFLLGWLNRALEQV